MADYDVDVIWWFGPLACHQVADTDNNVTTLSLTINLAEADSVFFADDPVCGVEADEIMSGIECCAKVIT